MRAYRIIGAERAELCEIERPALRPDEVMIRVGAAGICHTDIELAAAAAFLGSKLPLTAGHEIAGWVDEIGSDVSGLRLGDPVAVYEMVGCGRCRECLGGRDHVCAVQTEVIGVTRDGGLAENVAVPHRNAFKIADLDVVTASVLTDAGLTAYAAVGHAIDLLRPGATALVIGVGGVGHLAIQCVAALTSARIIAMDVDDDRLDLARVSARMTRSSHPIPPPMTSGSWSDHPVSTQYWTSWRMTPPSQSAAPSSAWVARSF